MLRTGNRSRGTFMKYFSCGCLLLLCFLFGNISPSHAEAQTGGSNNAGSKSSPSAEAQESPGSLGFSIESEMLTYIALQRDAEAVGCDVAHFLNQAPAPSMEAPNASLCEMPAS